MTHVKNVRAYLRPLKGLPVERQRAMCETACPGASITYYDAHEREAWLRALRRDELALVARLDVLPEPKRPGVKTRPMADFSGALTEAQRKAHAVMDAEARLSSADKGWRELVEYHGHRIARGHRELPKLRAKRMARNRWDAAEPGVVERWHSLAMRTEFQRWAQHWRDPQHTAATAFAALPEHLQKEFGSLTTVRRIFGTRTTGKRGRRATGFRWATRHDDKSKANAGRIHDPRSPSPVAARPDQQAQARYVPASAQGWTNFPIDTTQPANSPEACLLKEPMEGGRA